MSRYCGALIVRIGVFESGWFKGAAQVISLDAVTLPVPAHPNGPYAADHAARTNSGSELLRLLRDGDGAVDLMVDNGGAGLGFVAGAGGNHDLSLAHELVGKPLFSHFIDPLVTAFTGLAWPVVWQCLQSRSWIKAVWDRAQVDELQRFGVPSVIHLPMAAPDRAYNTEPLDPKGCKPIVSFVGGQNTSYFRSNVNVPSGSLYAGTLAQAVRADLGNVGFYDIYHDLYGLGEPISPGEDMESQIRKTLAYFNAKLFYNAGLCIRNRDRFVVFLKRKLSEMFRLAGRGWDSAYGLSSEPSFPTDTEYFNHFREAAINLNLVNGNAETGLNMRHFEITAAGGFMLCYHQPEIEEHFEVGKECDVFANESELLEKIRYYLAHSRERVEIALAGQRRTLSSHLYSHRLHAIIDLAFGGGLRPLPVTYTPGDWYDELELLVTDPDIILDCGANVGYVSRDLRTMYPRATIYAFEPVSKVHGQLCGMATEHDFHAVNMAVSDTTGRSVIHLTASPESNSLFGFQEGSPCEQWHREVGEEEIETCRLDDWCESNGIAHERIDILKLDIQGAELMALRGARKILQTARVVYLEVQFVPLYKDSPLFDEVETFMKECGYRRHAIYPSDHPADWGDAMYVKV